MFVENVLDDRHEAVFWVWGQGGVFKAVGCEIWRAQVERPRPRRGTVRLRALCVVTNAAPPKIVILSLLQVCYLLCDIIEVCHIVHCAEPGLQLRFNLRTETQEATVLVCGSNCDC